METIKAAILSAGITKEVKFNKGFAFKFISKDDLPEGAVIDIENAFHFSSDEDHIVHSSDGTSNKKVIIRTEKKDN